MIFGDELQGKARKKDGGSGSSVLGLQGIFGSFAAD